MTVRPLRDRVVVKADPLNFHTSSAGLILQARSDIHTSQEQLGRTGTVVAVGSCRMRWEDRNGKKAQRFRSDPPALRVGDRVLFGEFNYARTDEGHLVMSEADVVGVIDAA